MSHTPHELEPRTAAGRRFVELAEAHAAEFEKRAAEHDREGSFPLEAIDAMKASGFTVAAIPEEFDGFGLTARSASRTAPRVGPTSRIR